MERPTVLLPGNNFRLNSCCKGNFIDYQLINLINDKLFESFYRSDVSSLLSFNNTTITRRLNIERCSNSSALTMELHVLQFCATPSICYQYVYRIWYSLEFLSKVRCLHSRACFWSKHLHSGFGSARDYLTRCALVTCGDKDLGQHCFRLWLGDWRHQATTWTSVDLSRVRSSDICGHFHMRYHSHPSQ